MEKQEGEKKLRKGREGREEAELEMEIQVITIFHHLASSSPL